MDSVFSDNLLQWAVNDAIQNKNWLEAIDYAQAMDNKVLTGIALCYIYEALTGEMVLHLLQKGIDYLVQAIQQHICLN